MKKVSGKGPVNLRKKAEKKLKSQTERLSLSGRSTEELVHELETQQVELEMQNEELRRAQLELEKAGRRYADLYDFAPVGYLTLSGKGVIHSINITGATMLGLERSRVLKKSLLKFIVKDDWAVFLGHMKKVFGSRMKQTVELRLIKEGEGEIPVQLQSSFSDEEGGKVGQCLTVVIDLSERKQAEGELQKSEERLRIVLEVNSEGVWDWDIPSGHAVFSPRYSGMLGYEPDEFPKSYASWKELVHPDDFERVHKAHAGHINEGKEFCVELRMRKKSGEWCWILSRGVVVERDAEGRAVRMLGTHLDITERKRAENALRVSEERYRGVVETQSEMICRYLPDTTLLFVSESYMRYYNKSREELVSSQFLSYIPVEQHEDILSYFASFRPDSPIRTSEREIVFPDGARRWQEWTDHAFFQESGQVSGFQAVGRDITGRKQMQDKLSAAAEEWYKTFNTIQDMVMIMDREFRLVQMNEAAIKFLGLPKEQIIGNQCFTLMHGTESPIDGCPYKKMMDTKGHEETEIYDELRGKWFHVVVDPLLGATGDVIGVVHTVKDITRHKLAEIARTESMERYRAVVEAYDGFIYICSQDYRIEFMNQRLIERTGRNAVGELCYKALHDSDSVCQWCVNEQVLRGETVRWEVQSPKDHCWYYVVNTPIRHVDGTISKQSMIMDITARKQAEEGMKENEVSLRNSKKDLQKLAGRLISAQEEELRRLSRELHDDLTQRLAVLAIEAGKLELDLIKRSEKCPETIHTVAQIKNQLINVSEDVHNISRQLHPTILDDLGLVRAIESECALIMRRENIEIIFRKEDVPVEIGNDIALCLYRIIQEGLKNIVAHSRSQSCEVFLKGADDSICLTVKDDGVGFDPVEVRNKPGLGLSSMRERAQLVHGDFSIKSQPGQGSVIRIVVPLAGVEV